MRVITTDLFDLIHSMSGTEKAYVKKYARLHSKEAHNNYLELFNAIENQKEYDEPALLLKFKGRKFTRQFSVAKNYLYNQILQAMDAYHKSSYSEVRKLIHQTEFLINKGLLDQAERTIRKAEKIAKQFEIPGTVVEINDLWKMRIATLRSDWKMMEQIFIEEKSELSRQERTLEYRKLYAKMVDLYNRRDYLEKIKHTHDPLMDSKLVADPTHAETIQQKFILNQILSKHASHTGDYKKAHRHLTEKISLYDSNKNFIKIFLSDYVGTVSNATVTCLMLDKTDEIPSLLHKLEDALPLSTSKLQRFRIYSQISWLWLDYYIRKCNLEEANKKIEGILVELNVYRKFHGKRETGILYLNFAVCRLSIGDARGALKYLTTLRNDFNLDNNENMKGFLFLLLLVVHYELENTDVIESTLRSANQFFNKKSVLYESEQHILNFFRNLLSYPEIVKRNQAMSDLREKLAILYKDPEEAQVLFNFDLISWLDSKINGTTFEAAYKKNHGLL